MQLQELLQEYNKYKNMGLKLDMSRGKPCKEQLDLSEPMLKILSDNASCIGEGGVDYRNYGLLDGIPEAKKLFAELLDLKPENIIVGGNSSLNMMYDMVARAMLFGILGQKPWKEYEKISFLCVVPGYDRHFTVTESFGINMINIPLLQDGPDMDMVESFIKDETVKGIWCVPKYSNPDGITYSDAVVRRFANLSPAAKDFRIFWDNAYVVHDLDVENCDKLLNIFEACYQTGKQDMIYMFASTSKVTYPGAGVAVLCASEENIADIKKKMFAQTIGADKLNQLRHILYFKNAAGVRAYMKKHAAIVKPRFDIVLQTFEQELTGIASWHSPKGGYFISLNVPDGCASRVAQLMKDAGVVMTGAGSTYPYKRDPKDRNLRIAPTYPSLKELKTAVDILCLCVKIAALEKEKECCV